MNKLLTALAFVLACAAIALSNIPQTLAATNVNYNDLMDDQIFDAQQITSSQIDAFLNGFSGSCISSNRGFRAPNPTGYSPSKGFSYGSNVTAGRVIYDAASVYGLNPEVILATLQKEQSLVTGSAGCSTLAYSAALGYGCPDGGTTHNYSGINLYTLNGKTVTSVKGTCVSSALDVGFSRQVVHATWLFKFDEMRSEGKVSWAVQKPNWDNSDDPDTQYNGYMTQGTFQRLSSGPSAYYDGYATIDGTSVHMNTGATAALYDYTPHKSGNGHFVTIFSAWFGETVLPFAFKSPTSPNVYLKIDGYKFVVPSMGILQDYGISPRAIQTLDQGTINAIPAPDSNSGFSTSLNYIARTPDDPTVYLVSIDKKYPFASLSQFSTDFGFDTSNVAYLPDDFITFIHSGPILSNFIETPTSNAFQVNSGQKRIIFDSATFKSLDPSEAHTPVSYFDANLLPSGMPIVSKPTLVKYHMSEAVYLLDNSKYYSIPTIDTYRCWGFDSKLNTPLYQVADDSYIASISPIASLGSCVLNNGTSTFLLSRTRKYTLPAGYGVTATAAPADIATLANGLPTSSSPLTQYIKSNAGAAVWYIDSSNRRVVPTLTDFNLLSVPMSQLDIVDNSAVTSIPGSGIKLGTGSLVKADNSAAVYVIDGDQRVLYATRNSFLAYGNSFSKVMTYPHTELDAYYPYSNVSVNNFLYNQANSSVYLVDTPGCYKFTSSQLTDYGQSQSTIVSNQSYNADIFVNLPLGNCHAASSYAKSPDSGTVYYVSGDQKRSFPSWRALVAQSGQSNPPITNISSDLLDAIPSGPSM